jgi:hypothetical protein
MTVISEGDVLHAGDGLLGLRPAVDYDQAEQKYSALLYQRLERLLKGQRNTLLLLRRYHREPNRLGVMSTPPDIDRRALRITAVEKMALDVLAFLAEPCSGGPIAQEIDAKERVTERRQFPTRYPHILIDRVDTFGDGRGTPEWTEWWAQRVQNQRSSTLVNRMLDAANLGVELAKLLTRP